MHKAVKSIKKIQELPNVISIMLLNFEQSGL